MDTPNAIHLTTVNPDSDAPFYNLRGVKVLNPAKGNVYIVNGKKIIRWYRETTDTGLPD